MERRGKKIRRAGHDVEVRVLKEVKDEEMGVKLEKRSRRWDMKLTLDIRKWRKWKSWMTSN